MALSVNIRDSVASVMQAVERRSGLAAAEMVLCSGWSMLADPTISLSAAGIMDGGTLRAGGRLLGGGGKKKAKVMPKVVAREKRHLPNTFVCPFCDHHTIACSMYVAPPIPPQRPPPSPPPRWPRACHTSPPHATPVPAYCAQLSRVPHCAALTAACGGPDSRRRSR